MIYGRLSDKADGEPAATVRAIGVREVARLIELVHAAAAPELRAVGEDLVARANKTAGGRAALALLRDEGGPDLMVDVVQFAIEQEGFTLCPQSLTTALFTRRQIGGQLMWRVNCGPWRAISDSEAAAHASRGVS